LDLDFDVNIYLKAEMKPIIPFLLLSVIATVAAAH
jgi:hypothetical protein